MAKNWVELSEEDKRKPPMTRKELITWAVVCLSVIISVYLTVTWYIHYTNSHLPKAKPTCYSAEAL